MRDIDSAKAAVTEAELALNREAEEARLGLRGAIDAVIRAIRLAESEDNWPLYNGYRPAELAPGLRKALLAELQATRADEYAELDPELLEAMQA